MFLVIQYYNWIECRIDILEVTHTYIEAANLAKDCADLEYGKENVVRGVEEDIYLSMDALIEYTSETGFQKNVYAVIKVKDPVEANLEKDIPIFLVVHYYNYDNVDKERFFNVIGSYYNHKNAKKEAEKLAKSQYGKNYVDSISSDKWIDIDSIYEYSYNSGYDHDVYAVVEFKKFEEDEDTTMLSEEYVIESDSESESESELVSQIKSLKIKRNENNDEFEVRRKKQKI